MTVITDLPGATNDVLQSALSGYSDEAYTNARKLSGTGIVGSNPDIDVNTETYIGQVRWHKPLNPVVNVASLTNSADGARTGYASDYLRYVKSVRTHGAEKVNMAQVVTRVDGLAKIGRDFGETKAQDEHDAILSVLKGVAVSEALAGGAQGTGQVGLGGQTFDNDPTNKRHGFYVDLGVDKTVVGATASVQGAARAESFLRAFGMAYKDYEPSFAYLVTSPETMASLRSANLVDQDRVVDGTVEFQTIFDGKFRLVSTRANQSMSSADLAKVNSGPGVDIVGTKTSFIVLPGALAMEGLEVPMETEIERDAASFMGGGTTEIWYRWGYVIAPAGYDWQGSEQEFASNGAYMGVNNAATDDNTTLAAAGLITDIRGNWKRKTASALSLGILPIFHG